MDDEQRTPLVAGNWKMFKLRGEARDFAEGLAARMDELDEVDLAICPPLSCLTEVADVLAPLGVGVLAQNGHQAESGAYTAEDWLRIYSAHLEGHASQIERNLAAWTARG